MDTKQEKEKVYISDDTIQMVISLLFKRGYDKDYVERTVCNLLNVNVILNKHMKWVKSFIIHSHNSTYIYKDYYNNI